MWWSDSETRDAVKFWVLISGGMVLCIFLGRSIVEFASPVLTGAQIQIACIVLSY